MATALQLVNRVRRELRWGDTADFTDDLSKVVLDRVNDAQATIFETWDWDCDIRHDGSLITVADTTVTTVSVTNGVKGISQSSGFGVALANIIGEADTAQGVLRFIVTTDDDQSDDAGRIAWGWYDTSGLTAYATAGSSYLGTTSTSATLRFIVNEYGLPTTVRKVLSVTYQGNGLRLEESGRSQIYDRFVQRPHETVNDDPSVVIIGGTLAATIRSSNATSTPSTPSEEIYSSLLIYPTPSSAYRLDYSYLVQRSDLSAVTDVFRADRSLEGALVKLAFARCMQDAVGDFNPEAGMSLEQRVLRELAALHGNEMRDPGRHRVLGSNFCETSGKIDFGRLPRNFGTGT